MESNSVFLIHLSSTLLLIAFFFYFLSTIGFTIAVTGQKWSNRKAEEHKRRWGWIGYTLAAIGLGFQFGYFFTRWIGGGHIPTSNMFEFMTMFGLTIVLAFLIIYAIYKIPVFGIFAMPVGMIIIAYASVFPNEVTPLIPALQSYWLKIHVTTTALGEGILSVSFATGLMYLIRTADPRKTLKKKMWLELMYVVFLQLMVFVILSLFIDTFYALFGAVVIGLTIYFFLLLIMKKTMVEAIKPIRWLEFTLSVVLMLVGFIVLSTIFQAVGEETVFQAPNEQGNMVEMSYTMPSLIGPDQGKMIQQGYIKPLVEAPSWMKGVDAAEKLNTMVWSILSGIVLYVILRLIARKRLSQVMQPWVRGIDPEVIDEISYRAVSIGYPIFTLGALIFAMIWAAEAWGRFWGWDPKEVWALITWLFYTAYLHLRLSKGWHGEKSAWLAVLGFVFILFNLVVVNLVIAGLHSYAGV